MIAFSVTSIDHPAAEAQYTGFKYWISESEEHLKPELAQLLYPLFTHLYIRLLVHCGPALALRFHKRHLSTFLGNPEFKLFIQQLAEVSSVEEMEQSPTITTFRASKYNVTLTERTYQYLLTYLETQDSGLLLQILNLEVELTIGDPLGAGSRQEARAGLAPAEEPRAAGGREAGARARLLATLQSVREEPPCLPSIALYRVSCPAGQVSCAQADERGEVLALGGGDSALRLVAIQPPGPEAAQLEVGGSSVRLGWDRSGEPRPTLLRLPAGQGRALRGHSGPVYGLAHLRDGPLLSCSEDATVRVWDRGSGAALAVLRGHQYPVWAVRGDQLGLQFASCSMDRTARLWRPDTAHPLRVYAGHEGSVDCLDWHPNCNYLLTGSTDKTMRMWTAVDARFAARGGKGSSSVLPQVCPDIRLPQGPGDGGVLLPGRKGGAGSPPALPSWWRPAGRTAGSRSGTSRRAGCCGS
jgi:transcription initiation factor TFIID subunit 5